MLHSPSRRLAPKIKQLANVVTTDTTQRDRGVDHICSRVPLMTYVQGNVKLAFAEMLHVIEFRD